MNLDAFIASPELFRWRSLVWVKFGPIAGLCAAGATSSVLAAAHLMELGSAYEFYRTFLTFFPVAVVVGSVVFYWPLRLRRILGDAGEIKKAAFCFHGGLVGAMLLGLVVARLMDLSFVAMVDLTLLPVPLFHGLGRLACLNYGCCYGRETGASHWLAVRYYHPDAKANRMGATPGVPRHAVQLYELLGCIALTPLVLLAYFGVAQTGATLSAYLIGYGGLRLVVENYRENAHERWRGLSIWQWVSLGLVLAGVLVMFIWQPSNAQLPVSLSLSHEVLVDMVVYSGWSFLMLFVAYGVHFRQVGRWL